MTRPYQRWQHLWQLFMTLDEDCFDQHPDELSALIAEMNNIETSSLDNALAQWHEAFDDVSDEQLQQIVLDFNASYDPAIEFGGYRGWANWVREHLEAELARRQANLSDAGDPV